MSMHALNILQPSARSLMHSHALLLAAYDLWTAKRGERPMPLQSNIQLVDFPLKLLPWSILTEVLHEPLDFRYRSMGSAIIQMVRSDYTGRRFSELEHIRRGSQLWTQRASVVEFGQPMLATPPYTGPDGSIKRVYNLNMPIADTETDKRGDGERERERVGMIWTVVALER
jgi:hypothetical protein